MNMKMNLTEKYVLTLINLPSKETKLQETVLTKLSFVYVCNFLEFVMSERKNVPKDIPVDIEGLIYLYFKGLDQVLISENLLVKAFHTLELKKTIKIKHLKEVEGFKRINVVPTKDIEKKQKKANGLELPAIPLAILNDSKLKTAIEPRILKTLISRFLKRFKTYLNGPNKKNQVFELRLFWPPDKKSAFYDFSTSIFANQEKENTLDRYLIKKAPSKNLNNLKIRGDALQLKQKTSHYFKYINQFKPKQDLIFPLSINEINKLLNLSGEDTCSSIKEYKKIKALLKSIVDEVSIKQIIVKKSRQKFTINTASIEFATIIIDTQQWHSVCIESQNLLELSLLSLLIDQEGSRPMTYPDFLATLGADDPLPSSESTA